MNVEKRERLSIGALSKAAGVKVETIRYYEKLGLLPEPARTAGGNRMYCENDVRRLRFIRRARELGFRRQDVQTLLELSRLNDPGSARMKEITAAHLQEVRSKISSLRKLERTLGEMTRACVPGEQTSCPILESLGS